MNIININLLKTSFSNNEDKIKSISNMLNSYDNIILCGSNVNLIIAKLSKFLSDFYINKSINVITPETLINYTPQWLDKKDLIVFLSSKNDSKEMLDAIEICKKKETQIIILTNTINRRKKNNVYSILKKYYKVEFIEITQKNNNFLNFISYLTILNTIFIFYLQNQGLNVETLLKIQLLNLPILIDKLQNNKILYDDLKKIADKIINTKLVYFIGDGPRYFITQKSVLDLNNIKYRAIKVEDVIKLLKGSNIDKDSIFILFKPRESQVNSNIIDNFNKVKELLNQKFEDNLFILTPFKYVNVNSIGTKTDIILSPLYGFLIYLLKNQLNNINHL